MPSKSMAQHDLMMAAAHGAGYGPPPSVAKEFVAKDKALGKFQRAKKARRKAEKKA